MRRLRHLWVGLLVLFLLPGPAAARGQEAATCAGPVEESQPPAAAVCGDEGTAPVAAAAEGTGPRWPDVGLAAVALALGIFGVAVVRRSERRLAGRPTPRVERAPYLAGGALGVLFALSLVGLSHPVGISGGFRELMAGRLSWPVWTVAGVLLGGFLGALTDGSLRLSLSPVPGPVWRRWLAVFAGGVVLEISSAVAGGCTSGLALSGGIGLAPGAFVFMAAMFASGIPAALVAARRRP